MRRRQLPYSGEDGFAPEVLAYLKAEAGYAEAARAWQAGEWPLLSQANIYIQSAALNGRPLGGPWITHADLTAGGTLTLVMGPGPNRQWGAGAPPPTLPAGR